MDEDLPVKKPGTSSPNIDAEAEDMSAPGERVFDISGDTISLVKDSGPRGPVAPIQKNSQAWTSLSKTAPQKPPIELDTENLLDKKIGSFEATPFAKPAAGPSQPNINPGKAANSGMPTLVKGAQASIPLQDINAALNNMRATFENRAAETISTSINESNPITPVQVSKAKQKETVSAAFKSAPKFGPDAQATPRPEAAQPSSAATVTPSASTVQPHTPELANDGILKPLRTYETDVAEVMSHKRPSLASMAIAESKKEEESEVIGTNEPSHAGKNLIMLVLALLFIGGGAFGAYYLYNKSPLAPVEPKPIQRTIVSIIPSNTQNIITLGSTATAIKSQVQAEIAKDQAPGTIREIVLATKDSAGSLTRISAPEIISTLDIEIPDILYRSLTPEWMLGIYTNENSERSAFVVLTSNFFQNTFAGMLQWEQIMADDLRPYLSPETVRGIFNARNTRPINAAGKEVAEGTSIATASSSPQTGSSTTTSSTISTSTELYEEPLSTHITIRGKFEDRIIKNRDVRAFRTEQGNILFLYSFIDNTHLVITDKESTLTEIVTRLEKQTFIR